MATSTTVTVRMSGTLKEMLGLLAQKTQRTQSFLAERAIATYVERELEMMTAVEEGLEDFRTGDVVPHDEAMRRIRETIAKHES
ncbi:CopG family ribbon-helix-helix protein [Brevundimonas sp. SL130]|uniref:CopG family ribbon-helix-helix protein n=1 Tax=Brevundimonas sp. SL130 TaxID=2995143 RepID=UPI00226C9777|nr:CopG family transcriptional regulator [Brevundimonas sp. SL130]WAC58792.1 CopG family transcriptional regulator [Brevundimonas sp. SL130]